MNSSRDRRWLRWVILVVVLAIVALFALFGWRPLARRAGIVVPAAAQTVPAAMFSPTASDAPQGAGTVSPAPVPSSFRPASAQKVDAVVQATGVTPNSTMSVRDLTTGAALSSTRADDPVVPASTMKLMTTISLVDKVGATTTFDTKVVMESPSSIVLVGGGDPLLASSKSAYNYGEPLPPTTEELAAQTAAALKARGISQVSLGYDDSLFTGDARHPGWQPGDMEFVNDISALMVDEGGGSTTPAASAASTFAGQLAANGIQVNGAPSSQQVTSSAEALATVHSLPLSEIVQQCLRHSDNTIAETLFRHLAIAYGQPASFDGGVTALHQAMTDLGLWSPADSLHDGSGLDEADRLTSSSLSQAIVLAASREELRPILPGLPVAAATGTLDSRFIDAASSAGGGRVRAKTGSLDISGALVGYTPTADGSMVAFAIVANGAGTDFRPYLDKLAAGLASCRCSS